MLEDISTITSRVVAIDPNASRRDKSESVLKAIKTSSRSTQVVVVDIEESKNIVKEWTNDVGCNAVLEVSSASESVFKAYSMVSTRLLAIIVP